eukprot:TRINITY_DN45557_c0_g1_i1.p1 TRINITY_DN45557_c0_g1~~TRINITY_DN45557_c0_g1_i1.p1  ORF type:complete len:144 (+),score=48.80 TRINITY_DN45557_c0_g1_i1:30-461(+)
MLYSLYDELIIRFFFFKQKTAYEMLRSLVGSEMCIRDSSHPRPTVVKTAQEILTLVAMSFRGSADPATPLQPAYQEALLVIALRLQDATIQPDQKQLLDQVLGDDPSIVLQYLQQFPYALEPRASSRWAVSYTHLTLPTKRIV